VVVLEDEEAHEVEPNGHGGDYSDNLDTWSNTQTISQEWKYENTPQSYCIFYHSPTSYTWRDRFCIWQSCICNQRNQANQSNWETDLQMNANSTSVVHQSMCNGFTALRNLIKSNSEYSVHSGKLSDGLNFTAYPESCSLHDIPPISQQYQNPGKGFPLSPHDNNMWKFLIEFQSIRICLEIVVCP
jgi:hypothetical protein